MRVNGPWSESQLWSYTERAVVPAKLACVDESGWPTIASLWFLPEDGAFWCATPASAQVAKWIESDPRCAIEIAPDTPPYAGVRARGRASIEGDPERRLLRRLIRRYLGSEDSSLARWLLARDVEECAIRIEPLQLRCWDYAQRMRGAA